MIAIFCADGFEEAEAIVTYDILKRAGTDVRIAGVGAKSVIGSHGLKITADMEIGDIDSKELEMAILPGGMPGTRNLEGSAEVIKLIKKMHNEKKKIAAICAAPSILGRLGILEDKEAACFPGFEEYLRGAVISRKDAVTDENITTSKGPGTVFAFAYELVRILKGEKTARQLADGMQYKEKRAW